MPLKTGQLYPNNHQGVVLRQGVFCNDAASLESFCLEPGSAGRSGPLRNRTCPFELSAAPGAKGHEIKALRGLPGTACRAAPGLPRLGVKGIRSSEECICALPSRTPRGAHWHASLVSVLRKMPILSILLTLAPADLHLSTGDGVHGGLSRVPL